MIEGLRTTMNSSYRRLIVLLPIGLFAALLLVLGWGLTRDPQIVPSALVGKPVPEFALPPVQGRTLGLSSGDLKGEVSLVNVFASWCVSCRYEHPILMELKRRTVVPIHGLNYKDDPDAAESWLNDLGDPYTRTGADRNGRVAIEWGIYGVPETFVIGTDARIAYRHVGPITEQILDEIILPLVEELRTTRPESQL